MSFLLTRDTVRSDEVASRRGVYGAWRGSKSDMEIKGIISSNGWWLELNKRKKKTKYENKRRGRRKARMASFEALIAHVWLVHDTGRRGTIGHESRGGTQCDMQRE